MPGPLLKFLCLRCGPAAGRAMPWYSSPGSDFNYDFRVTIDESVTPVEFNFRDAAELRPRPSGGVGGARGGPGSDRRPPADPPADPQAVDNHVDDPVESRGAQGINGRCPVDDQRIFER
jgi:predicted dithiol-disulfide oxidoreductase (DUF899 family)